MDISKLVGRYLSLETVTTPAALQAWLADFSALCSAKHFVLITGIQDRWHFTHNLPTSWVDEYQAENSLLVDPLICYAFKTGQFATWQQVRDLRCGEASVLARACDYGVQDGVVAPIKMLTGEWAVLILAHSEAINAQQRGFLHMATNAALPTLLAKATQSDTCMQPILTQREKQCIALAASGLTTEEIAKQLNIRARTVLFHLANVTNKLGAKNRQHAIAKAIQQNLVFLAPDLKNLRAG